MICYIIIILGFYNYTLQVLNIHRPLINHMLATDNKTISDTESAFKKKVSLQIRKIRRQQRVTQEKFYTDTNINIARLESGKIDIRLETLRKICVYFDVSLSGFFQGMY